MIKLFKLKLFLLETEKLMKNRFFHLTFRLEILAILCLML